jgi:RNA polymerase sigma-54 factor
MNSMRIEMSPRQVQVQKLAPRMIQTLEILQLPIIALQERIERELQENPVLELREAREDGEAPAEETTQPEPQPFDPDGPLVHDKNNELDFQRLEALDRDWDGLFNEEHRPSRNRIEEEGDKKLDAMQNMPSRPVSLQDSLEEQIPFLDLTPDQYDVIDYLIANLDERGYLTTPLEELAQAYDKKPVTAAELEEVLLLLQKLDPPGVGARDLKECLLLQLAPETPHREVVRTLILNHLEDINLNRIPVIQRKTGFPLQVIQEAIEVLKHGGFDPLPGARFTSEITHYVVPDIIVERNEETGEYEIRLTDDWTPNLRISPKYIHMYKDKTADPQTRDYLRRKIQAADWLRDAIQQRRNTLEKVTRAIIQHQRGFLDKGAEFIQPLKMQQIADQVGVHVTTVSRAVDDKWVQTPRGVFPLKRFFGGGTKNEVTGEDVAWEKIKQRLLELIAAEDKSNPLSDEELVDKFKEGGFDVARRTVTKYRKLLKIPSSRQRKAWSA